MKNINKNKIDGLYKETTEDALAQIISSLKYLSQEANRAGFRNLSEGMEGLIRWSKQPQIKKE